MKHLRRIVIVVIVFIGLSVIGLNHFSMAVKADSSSGSTKINEILQLIHTNHLSGVSEEKLTDAAIKGMIDSLQDPYTQYFSKEEEAKFTDAIDGRYVGIGIRMDHDDEGIYINELMSGSSGEQSGLMKATILQQ
ncbi:MAG: carboxyl-terminal protease [Bacilli bacterium]|nr:carboxyl-terminal protease [Bacilli bacterium]